PARTDLLENLEVSERDLEEDLRYSEPRRLALDVLVERGEVPYRQFLEREGIADFLSRGEVEHIRRHLLVPPAAEAASVESAVVANGADDGADDGGDRSGSSGGGTYWPTVSDVVVPDLELGWPSPSNAGGPCRGQTNPPLGEGVPTIKQVVRRMLWQATQVIAIVMDVFSDVDIFRDLMDVACVRKVPVYIVLDNIGFPTFRNMCDCCGVNAGNIENMRVRVIKGTVHCCRTGKKFHGQMLEKFLLVDCRVALCGSYSFTWSYEKINRSIVQVFTGQVVEIFDEEFRILYGQSETPDSSCSPSRGIAQQR
uniref:Scaffolding anchor of CK1 domain-containing protein n=1 Tax=Petromyzon marinus TaxID=7757 RepID=S4RPV2_PETMA